MAKSKPLTIQCGTHGKKTPAVVCRHHLSKTEKVVGFVENSSEPDDLQAWCDDCEAMFDEEGEMTDRFRQFNRFAVVCVFCYEAIKARHSKIA